MDGASMTTTPTGWLDSIDRGADQAEPRHANPVDRQVVAILAGGPRCSINGCGQKVMFN
jgi:hypothetical protein